MQHGGRDNDWRHRPWTMPETIRRACRDEALTDDDMPPDDSRYVSCINDISPLKDYDAKTNKFTMH